MKYFGEDEQYIKAECEKCGRVLKIKREYCIKNSSGFNLNPPIKCSCGEISNFIRGISQNTTNLESSVKCPKCNSSQITANNKGFGLGKAAVGGFLLGPIGLLGGLFGSKRVMITCLKCGYAWKAGK